MHDVSHTLFVIALRLSYVRYLSLLWVYHPTLLGNTIIDKFIKIFFLQKSTPFPNTNYV